MPFTRWLHTENITSILKIEIPRSSKIEAFEYFVMAIYNKMNRPKENNLTFIKLQALLFLTLGASLKRKTNDDMGLLSVFDNWFAMTYGNIEKDITDYHRSNNGQYNGFKIDASGIQIIE